MSACSRLRPTWMFAVVLMLGGALGLPVEAVAQNFSGSRPPEASKEVRVPVGFRLMVGQLSPKPGPVDPELAAIHRIMVKEFRYESLRLLQTRKLMLHLEEVGGIELPTGKRIQIRPMHLGQRGVLVAVDIEGGGQLDLRVPNRRPVVLGTDNYQGGKLFFTLEPDY